MNGTSLIAAATLPTIRERHGTRSQRRFQRRRQGRHSLQNADGPSRVVADGRPNILSGANVRSNPGRPGLVSTAAISTAMAKPISLAERQRAGRKVADERPNVLSGAIVGINPGRHGMCRPPVTSMRRQADILWQKTADKFAVWLMNGTSLIRGASVDYKPGAAWRFMTPSTSTARQGRHSVAEPTMARRRWADGRHERDQRCQYPASIRAAHGTSRRSTMTSLFSVCIVDLPASSITPSGDAAFSIQR